MRTRTFALSAAAAIVVGCTGGAPSTGGPTAIPTAEDRTAAAPTSPAPTATATPEPRTAVMWARGGLPVEVAAAAAAVEGVAAAVHVRSDTLGLVGARAADGTVVTEVEDGWRIPVDVMAVDPVAAELLPEGADREAVADLRPGEVLLPASSAALRGLAAGDELDLVGRPGLVVAAVVADDLLGNDEVVVHAADADAVGLEAEGSLLLGLAPDAPADVDRSLAALAPGDRPARVVGATEDGPPRRTPLVLSLLDVKQRFGEFAYRPRDGVREVDVDPAWVDEHVVLADVPILGRVYCHERIVPDLRAALQAVVDAGLADTIDPDDYAGCFYARRIGTDTTSLSRHSWGIAVDVNVDVTMEGLGPLPEPEVVDAFAEAGFRWGGLFLSPDNHHFEWVGEAALVDPPAPPDVAAAAPAGP